MLNLPMLLKVSSCEKSNLESAFNFNLSKIENREYDLALKSTAFIRSYNSDSRFMAKRSPSHSLGFTI